jgi:hypothetical protein
MKPLLAPPIITLTTDFGLADHYTGTLKGVLLSRCSDARIIDISHEVPPFSILAGAYTISQAASYFPPGTIHVVVIDPGVGTVRKAILVEASGQFFVAPDNGVLSLITAKDPHTIAREITNQALWLPSPSHTFHGRDIFAPVAGSLANGSAMPDTVGPLLEQIERLPGLEPEQLETGSWRGMALSVDHFGNVITNFSRGAFARIAERPFTLEAGTRQVTTFRSTFGDAPADLCFAYFGSSGYLELGMNQRSAAAYLGVWPGETVRLGVTIV